MRSTPRRKTFALLDESAMQMAGTTCKICGNRIVFSDEGAFCAQCGTVMHRTCAAGFQCDVCGQPYQRHAPSKANPMEDAVLPRSLRPTKTATPAAIAILLAFLAVVLVLLVLYLGTLT
jgi:hypothetical protein